VSGNSPYLYAQQPNAINLHQLDLHAIRLPDTYQTDHIDWGFRVDALDGMDYRFPTMSAIFTARRHNSVGQRPCIFLCGSYGDRSRSTWTSNQSTG
jgi:hypothetical protein